MVACEQCQILKHLGKKFLHRKEFTKNNIQKKMAATRDSFSGPQDVMDHMLPEDLRQKF